MKKRYLIVSIFTILLVIMSLFAACYNHYQFGENLKDQSRAVYDYLNRSFELENFVYDTIDQTVMTQELFTVKDATAQEDDLIAQFSTYSIYSSLYGSDFFDYVLYKDGAIISQDSHDEKGPLIFNIDLSFDENGNVSIDNLIEGYEYHFKDLRDVIANGLNTTNSYDSIVDRTYTSSDIILNTDLLKDYSLNISLSAPLSWNNAYHMSSIDNLRFAPLICLGLISLMMALFVFLVPYQSLATIGPFKIIQNVKFLWLSIFYMGSYAIFISLFFTLDYYVAQEFISTYINAKQNLLIADIFFFLLYLAFSLFIALFFFSLKTIIILGPKNYLRDHSVLVSIFRSFKNLGEKVIRLDLNDGRVKEIGLLVIVNILVFVILYFLPFGFILGVLYIIILGILAFKQLKRVENDFQIIKAKLSELADGNFDIPKEDVGVFNSLNDVIDNIESGFKKAVIEETRSQNMKNELISNVSHDLKTPLTCIKNYLTLLDDEKLDDKTRKAYLMELKEYADRLTRLVNDIFDVSKANSGNIELKPCMLDLASLLEQSLEEKKDDLQKKNLKVIANYCNNTMICLDPDKTYRIFDNLLSNVAKYALEGSRVYIDMQNVDGKLFTTIKNISESEMNFTSDEIVERFVRGDKSRYKTGSGIGLAIVKSFIEAQQGSFKIEIDGDLFKAIVSFVQKAA